MQRRFFIGKFREDLIEVRDFENFFDFRRQADYFHLPALFDYGNVNARELADPELSRYCKSVRFRMMSL